MKDRREQRDADSALLIIQNLIDKINELEESEDKLRTIIDQLEDQVKEFKSQVKDLQGEV